MDFDTGSHNSAPQVTRNIRRINNRFNVIVLTSDGPFFKLEIFLFKTVYGRLMKIEFIFDVLIISV